MATTDVDAHQSAADVIVCFPKKNKREEKK